MPDTITFPDPTHPSATTPTSTLGDACGIATWLPLLLAGTLVFGFLLGNLFARHQMRPAPAPASSSTPNPPSSSGSGTASGGVGNIGGVRIVLQNHPPLPYDLPADDNKYEGGDTGVHNEAERAAGHEATDEMMMMGNESVGAGARS